MNCEELFAKLRKKGRARQTYSEVENGKCILECTEELEAFCNSQSTDQAKLDALKSSLIGLVRGALIEDQLKVVQIAVKGAKSAPRAAPKASPKAESKPAPKPRKTRKKAPNALKQVKK